MAETDGILLVGEISVVRRRDSPREENHDQAWRSGRESAFREVQAFVGDRLLHAGPFDDTRPLTELETFLIDRLTEVPHATP